MQANTGDAFSDTAKQLVVQTDDATPTTVFSFPVKPETVVKVTLDAAIFSLDETKLASGNAIAVFARTGTGNVTRPGTISLQVQANNFGAPALGLNLAPNTQTQAIDVVLTGQPGVSIRWHLDLVARQTP